MHYTFYLFAFNHDSLSHIFTHTGASSLGSTVAMELEQIIHPESLMPSNSGITKQTLTWIFHTLMEMIGSLIIVILMLNRIWEQIKFLFCSFV